ncbi:hypothetical protein VOLCADRAFT_99072 [Volvox carteri f. nagariensis]|uniref:Uncharacterized protein n=1 Tax=Volvox carteri f. nagariensis TaxID=3068 RepID=D8UGZ1_VOLCA|nr:uncharacterized protein VOLCADRAFT_99072 [Volvox carteri f. nagariensis]EFJ41036.1 hypothetical protein VOLCADRAFT_99072 [Volvox carteri f. nagariensis]|eukprot:XP_002957900.1 hypothetical protein VOLCADRAFT_99072 [Volvox carteri f. nagariensis]
MPAPMGCTVAHRLRSSWRSVLVTLHTAHTTSALASSMLVTVPQAASRTEIPRLWPGPLHQDALKYPEANRATSCDEMLAVLPCPHTRHHIQQAVRHGGASEAHLQNEADLRLRCAGAPIADLQPSRVKHCVLTRMKMLQCLQDSPNRIASNCREARDTSLITCPHWQALTGASGQAYIFYVIAVWL